MHTFSPPSSTHSTRLRPSRVCHSAPQSSGRDAASARARLESAASAAAAAQGRACAEQM